MKELRGSASAGVATSADHCLAFLQDIEGYPRWYPEVVRRAEIARPSVRDRPVRARTTVRLTLGPVRRDFDLLIEMSPRAERVVRLTRVGHDADDPEELSVTWRIDDGPSPGTIRLTVEVSARLEVPRLLPTQGVGDAVARGFVSAAARALAGQA
jgi:hypothetical protein